MLTLLLDEHMAPRIAEQITVKDAAVRIVSIHRWHGGEFLYADDFVILEAAYREQITLVTFDRSTIRPVLKEWGEQGRSHGGVIFIDERSIAQNDYGGLVLALQGVLKKLHEADFTDLVLYLQPVRRH